MNLFRSLGKGKGTTFCIYISVLSRWSFLAWGEEGFFLKAEGFLVKQLSVFFKKVHIYGFAFFHLSTKDQLTQEMKDQESLSGGGNNLPGGTERSGDPGLGNCTQASLLLKLIQLSVTSGFALTSLEDCVSSLNAITVVRLSWMAPSPSLTSHGLRSLCHPAEASPVLSFVWILPPSVTAF